MNAAPQNRELEETFKPVLAWLDRHVNAHRFLWLLALACFLIAWNRGIALLYGLLSLILALQALSWLLPWLAIRSVTVTRTQLGPAQAGKKLKLRYHMDVPATRYHMVLMEALPCAVDIPVQMHFLPSVESGTGFDAEVLCDRRGVFTVNDIGIGSGWPFGLVDLSLPLETPPCRLVVMPRTFRIAHLPMLRSDISAIDGFNRTAQLSQQSEFAGVREYRFGDSLKHIHWSASARHQELIVREYESHDRPHFLVVLDARPEAEIGDAPHSSFEYAVSIAASMIEYAIDRQLGLHLIAAAGQPLEISISQGCKDAYAYLEQLAWLKADGDTPYPEVIQQALVDYGEVNTLVTIRNQSQSSTLPRILSGHLDILLQDESFIHPVRSYREGWVADNPNRRTLHLSRNSNPEDLFQA